jgi:hypothetical protein
MSIQSEIERRVSSLRFWYMILSLRKWNGNAPACHQFYPVQF